MSTGASIGCGHLWWWSVAPSTGRSRRRLSAGQHNQWTSVSLPNFLWRRFRNCGGTGPASRPSLTPRRSTYSIAAVPIFTGANTSNASWVCVSAEYPRKPGLHSLQDQKPKQPPVVVHRSHHSASWRAMPSCVVTQAQQVGVSPLRPLSVYHQPDLTSPVNCQEDRKN